MNPNFSFIVSLSYHSLLSGGHHFYSYTEFLFLCFDHTSHSTPNLISKISHIFFRFPFLSFSRHLTLARTPVGIHLLYPDTPLHFILLMYYLMTLSLIIFCSLCFIYSFFYSKNNYTSSPNPVSFSHLSGFVLSLKYFSYSI